MTTAATDEDDDDETVVVVDVDPSVIVLKTATPSSLPEPGGVFAYDRLGHQRQR